MHWLLVAFVFNVSTTGELGQPEAMYRAFPTEQECNATGDRLREVLGVPETTKTISFCVDEAAFRTSGWKMLGVPELPKEQTGPPSLPTPQPDPPQAEPESPPA